MTAASRAGPATAPPSGEDGWLRFAPLIEKIVRRWSEYVDADYGNDLRQVARLAVWRALRTHHPGRGATLKTYVFCCAQRSVVDALRAYRRDHAGVISLEEIPVELPAASATFPPGAARGETGSAGAFAASLERDDLRAAFLQLQQREPEIVARSYGDDATDAEIAAGLDATTAATKKGRQRALLGMAAYLRGGAEQEESGHRTKRRGRGKIPVKHVP